MKKIFTICVLSAVLLSNYAYASVQKAQCSKSCHPTHGKNGKVSPKTIGAGALSLLVWPGVGQLMNDEKNTEKVLVHAVLGFTGIFRFWSCYDGVVNRKGGVWDNRI